MPRITGRAAAGLVLGYLLALAGMVALCAGFAAGGHDIPPWAIAVGRWIPALASLLALLVVPLVPRRGRAAEQTDGSRAEGRPTRLADIWRLRPGGWRGLLRAWYAAMAVMAVATIVPAIVAGVVTGTMPKGPLPLASVVPLLVIGSSLLVVSTIGEEVFWRGHAHTVLRALGFWPMALVVAIAWAAWHVPMQWLYWRQGTFTATESIALTVGIAAWAPLLAALVERFGSVWPAAAAHAVPFSAGNLLREGAMDETAPFWVVNALTWIVMLALAAVVIRWRGGGREEVGAREPTPS